MSFCYRSKFYKFDKLKFALLQLQAKDECIAANPNLDQTIFPRCSSPIPDEEHDPCDDINQENVDERYELFETGLQNIPTKIQKVRGVKTQPKNIINGYLKL